MGPTQRTLRLSRKKTNQADQRLHLSDSSFDSHESIFNEYYKQYNSVHNIFVIIKVYKNSLIQELIVARSGGHDSSDRGVGL